MTFIGFWTEGTAVTFAGELEAAIGKLSQAGRQAGDYLYMADFRNSPVQSAVMVERFQGFASSVGVKARRIAVLVGSSLQKKQTQRMAAGYDHYRFFMSDEEDDAERWLLSV